MLSFVPVLQSFSCYFLASFVNSRLFRVNLVLDLFFKLSKQLSFLLLLAVYKETLNIHRLC